MADPSADQVPTTDRVKGWKLWLFRFIAVVLVPAALIVLLEIGLRIAGFGYATTATVTCEVGGADGYRDNLKFGWRYFPRELAREFIPFAFAAEKSPRTCRIFVLGGSAAQGVPEAAFSFGRILESRLRHAYPGIEFEVINAAMTAVNSHVVTDIAADCAGRSPDLFVIYLGNNEVVGPYGAGTVFSPLSPSLTMIRMGKWIKSTRLGQLMTQAIGAIAGGGEQPRVWRGLGLFLDKQVRADDPGLRTVYEHFRSNLECIIDHAAGSGAPVVCCTVGSNLKDCPPFASQHRTDLSAEKKDHWARLYEAGIALEKKDPRRAVVSYLAAAEIDETYAELQFRLGECYWVLGEFEKARESYVRARDLDTLRFRADTRINEIIRETAAGWRDKGVVLVDAEKVLDDQGWRGIPGRDLFHEHVHMTFKGNDILARAVQAAVEDLLPQRIRDRKGPAADPPDEATIAADLAFNDWALRRIKVKMFRAKSSEAPFTNQLYLEERVKRMRAELREIESRLNPAAMERIAQSYRRLIGQRPEDWPLREKHAEFLLECRKDARAAVQEYERIVAGLPHHYHAWVQLGILKGSGNDFEEAIIACREAIRLQPYSADAHYTLGLSLQKTGRTDDAIDSYSRTLKVRPSYGPAWNNLAGLIYSQGRADEAIETYRRGLEILPESAELHYNLGELFRREKRRVEAIAEFNAVLAIDPNSARARRALETLR